MVAAGGAGPRIVVGGEVLVDLLPDRDGDRPAARDPGADEGDTTRLRAALGGAPLNVAVALARLGTPTSMLTRISTDPFGEALHARLLGNGVDTAPVQRGPEPTTLAVVTFGADGSACYSFYVEGTADRLITDPGPLPAGTTALALGGLSMLLEPGASVYAALLEREAAAGRFVSLDPNIRTPLITDADAHRTRLRSWLPSVGLLKLSDEDGDWLGGTPRDWLDAGVGAVVLTGGADGLAAVSPVAGEVHVPARGDRVVDTIGAGDSVHAAVLAWLAERGALSRAAVAELDAAAWREALDFASRVAAVTVSRRGAEPPTRDEVVIA